MDAKTNSFDKEAWKKQKQEERDRAFAIIAGRIDKIKTDPVFERLYLNLQSRFRKFSVNNVMLIAEQMPEATELADSDTWKKAGIYLKKDVKGIVMLEPGGEYTRQDGSTGKLYKTKKMFDISQTTEKREEPPKTNWDGKMLVQALIADSPCPLKIDETVSIIKDKVAYYEPNAKIIYVERGHTAGELFRAIARELASAHLEGNDEYTKYAGTIGEAVSYILCSRSGIDTSGFTLDKLMQGLEKRSNEEVRTILNLSRSIANRVSDGMDQFFGKDKAMGSREAR